MTTEVRSWAGALRAAAEAQNARELTWGQVQAELEHEPIPASELQAMVVSLWEDMQEVQQQVKALMRRVAELEAAGGKQGRMGL